MKAHDFIKGWTPERDEGLILLGNGRIFPWLAKRLKIEAFVFQIEPDRIVNTRIADNPPDDFSEGFVRGIVARKRSKDLNCWLTVIAGNHGRCSEGWVKYLLTENELTRLFAGPPWNRPEPIPEQFELYALIPVDDEEVLTKVPGHAVPFVVTECVFASPDIHQH